MNIKLIAESEAAEFRLTGYEATDLMDALLPVLQQHDQDQYLTDLDKISIKKAKPIPNSQPASAEDMSAVADLLTHDMVAPRRMTVHVPVSALVGVQENIAETMLGMLNERGEVADSSIDSMVRYKHLGRAVQLLSNLGASTASVETSDKPHQRIKNHRNN